MTIDLPKVASVIISTGSAAVSAYVWVQQRKANRPHVACDLAGYHMLGVHIGRSDDTIRYFLSFKVILSNLSAQPNALLRAEFLLRDRSKKWVTGEPEERPRTPVTAFPVNLPPRTTTALDAVACFELPRSKEPADQDLDPIPYLRKITTAPLAVRVRLTSLGGHKFDADLPL